MAPSAQLNGALAIGVGAGGSIGPVMEGGNAGSVVVGGKPLEGGVTSSPPLLLPPPQPDKAARNNRPDNHLWCLLWRTCFRISVVFIGILGAQLALQAWTGIRLGPDAMEGGKTRGQHGEVFREEANGKRLQGDVGTLQSRVDPKVFAII